MDLGRDASDIGVFKLITDLCNNVATRKSALPASKVLVSKMRSHSYELLLKTKSKSEIKPIVDLLSCYYVANEKARNFAEYENAAKLKNIIEVLQQTNFIDSNRKYVQKVLKLLTLLSSTEQKFADENFQKPLTYGQLDQVFPKPKREVFGSIQPYSFYPAHMFDLPFSLKGREEVVELPSHCCSTYALACFDTQSLIPGKLRQHVQELKAFISPMSLASMSSSHCQSLSNPVLEYQLPGSRDLEIPQESLALNGKVLLSSYNKTPDIEVKEMYRAKDETAVDIWEIASQLDKEFPEDIWEIVAKLPSEESEGVVGWSGGRVVALQPQRLGVLTERQLVRNVIFLLFGTETSIFYYHMKKRVFFVNETVVPEWRSKSNRFMQEFLRFGSYHRRIYDFAFDPATNDRGRCRGIVFEAIRVAAREYLVRLRARLAARLERCGGAALPVLLLRLRPLQQEMLAFVRLTRAGEQDTGPYDSELMAHMFAMVSREPRADSCAAAFALLVSLCRVYFKFIERFIFEGELHDQHNEFFIRVDKRCERSRSDLFWNSAFFKLDLVKVPKFLQKLVKGILLCGKTLKLLKICNPNDPLVYLISSDHPTIRCCSTMAQLEQQQAELEVYRTRCRFVGGEPVTFKQIQLEKEAERQACADLAAIKQAETIEKIVAERKRLAQLMIAEKKHSLRVLKAAMTEAKAAKELSRRRARACAELEAGAAAAAEEVDSALRDSEKSKIMEYYSKLSEQVEKSKLHTKWRMKRLQLDQSRMQLLSTEERNLKHEKIELEFKLNEEMAMSTRSDIYLDARSSPSEIDEKLVVSCDDINIFSSRDTSEYDFNIRNPIAKTNSPKVLSPSDSVDSYDKLDSQSNIISPVHTTSAGVIGKELNNAVDNQQYLDTRQQALINKQAVMAHEYATDGENNMIIPTIEYVDTENNLQELTPNQEARRNKLKVLGDEFNLPTPEIKLFEPRTDAQREAVVNRKKVLGTEYNLPCESTPLREPANIAQEEALRNKKKVLDSEFDYINMKEYSMCEASPIASDESLPASQGSVKRSSLKLDLKQPAVSLRNLMTLQLNVTDDVQTPCVMPDVITAFSVMHLNVETPNDDSFLFHKTASRTPVKERLTLFSPHYSKKFDSFSLMGDMTAEMADGTFSSTGLESPPISSLKCTPTKQEHVQEESIDDFDPFGLKRIRSYNSDVVDSKEELETSPSGYTHAALIMEEVKKKPSSMFASLSQEDVETSDSLSTLTRCLHKSVLQPLAYQLEVVNNSILTYFLVNLDMYGHMCALKDYFLLLDGDFARSICYNIFAKLASTTNPMELLNFTTLRGILDKSLGSTGSQYRDKYSEKLTFTFSEPPLSFQLSSPDALQCLSLAYSVDWPLNIILSKEALMRYSKAFQFLLKMKRISWVLMQDFEYLKRRLRIPRECARKLRRSPQYITLQNYRHIMATLIKALDNYITTSCILAAWREYEDDLKKARTLDDLYECHAVYVKKVLFRCLLNKRSTPVMKLLNDIFTVILKFSRVLQNGNWCDADQHYEHEHYQKLDKLYHIFDQLYRYLNKVIRRLLQCNYQPQLLDDLLTAIDFNGYCRVKKPPTRKRKTDWTVPSFPLGLKPQYGYSVHK